MGGHHLERTVELTQNEATVGNIASRVCTCSQLALCSAISCNRESYKISVGLRYCAEVRHLNQHTVAEPILRDLLLCFLSAGCGHLLGTTAESVRHFSCARSGYALMLAGHGRTAVLLLHSAKK